MILQDVWLRPPDLNSKGSGKASGFDTSQLFAEYNEQDDEEAVREWLHKVRNAGWRKVSERVSEDKNKNREWWKAEQTCSHFIILIIIYAIVVAGMFFFSF
jgi:hypothetical protein